MADSPPKQRFQGLDGLRGICALTVVLLHCELLFNAGAIFCHGYLAVDMFFILSGFVIAASYDAKLAAGLTARQFLATRLRRLAPVYWTGLGLCVAAALAARFFGASQPGLLLHGALAAVLVPRLGVQGFAYPANFVAWTLVWELVVNLLYAGWLRRVSSGRLAVLSAVLLAAALGESLVNPWGWSFGMTGTDLALGGLRALPEFVMGVLLLRAFRQGRLDRLPQISPLLPLAAWGALASVPAMPPLFDLAVVLACPLLVALLVRGDAAPPPWFRVAGDLSYPLYASHLAIIMLAQHTPLLGLDRGPRPLRALGAVLLALGMAWLLHRLTQPSRAGRSVCAGSAVAACEVAIKLL